MILAAAAALLCFSSTPSLERIEELAWQDQTSRAEQSHQDDLKADVDVGAKYAAEVEKHCKMSADQQMVKRVQKVGAEMAEIANQTASTATWGDKRFNTFNYTFKVIEDSEPNAFSLPGGYIYVQSGLMKLVESDDELAGVLAHEISHAKFRHVATLQRESSKITLIQLPIILAAILSGSPNAGVAVEGSSLAGTALVNGWTVQAEQAADYGGIQLMVKSRYNATGMLTLMEHLGVLEQSQPQYYSNLGIFRTHPPSKERADSMIKDLKQYGVPVERSKVSTSFRVIVKPDDKIPGAVVLTFAGRNLFALAGNDALTRADEIAGRLNHFLDSTPSGYEVVPTPAGVIGGRNLLLEFAQEDATAQSKTIPDLVKESVTNIRSALYTVAVRIWTTH
jgi:predicted Zn-dependent protease